jgi:hypothetical protein
MILQVLVKENGVHFLWKTQGLFGLGDIPKWIGVATEKMVTTRLVQRVGVARDNQILGIYL